MINIVPAILTDSLDRFRELVRKLEPYTNRVHIDVADGNFVTSKTVVGYEEIKGIESSLKFDVHLMVSNPREHIKEWLYTQADRFVVHMESSADLNQIIELCHDNKREVGLALNPETDSRKIEPYVYKVDFVQFMTVYPGAQGSEFVKKVIDKIAVFHEKYNDIMIMCDGGITPDTAPDLIKAGASELVSGSYIVKSDNIEEAIQQLQEAVG